MGWLANAVSRSADQVEEVVAYAEDLRLRWRGSVADLRADAAAHRLLELVPQYLVVTAPMVADLLGVSAPSARGAIEALADRGILQPLDLSPRPARPGRPAQWWMAGDLVSLVGRWSR